MITFSNIKKCKQMKLKRLFERLLYANGIL